MTDEAMSPLRRRMIEDMSVRKFVEKTQKDYIRHVKDLTIFLGRSPETAMAEDLRRYQLHLTNSGARPPTINSMVSALRFFFSVTLDRPEITKRLTFVAEPRKIPVVLSPEEVARFLEAAPGQSQGGTQHRLWRGPACFRGCRAEGGGHRFQAHAVADRARQGAQGSPRDALPATARVAAGLVAHRATPGLAVSRTEPGQPPHHASVQSRRSCRRPTGRDQEAGDAAHAAPQLRNPPVGAEHRHPGDPSSPRPRQLDITALYTRSPPTRSARSRARWIASHRCGSTGRAARRRRGHGAAPGAAGRGIFRGHGSAWREANAGHVSLGQLKVMSAIESCCTAALGGHVARCENCCTRKSAVHPAAIGIARAQGAAAQEWLAAREAELLPVPYYHVVFTLPAAIADIAYQNKAVIDNLLFKALAETLTTIAADPKDLGARIGALFVLHTWARR